MKKREKLGAGYHSEVYSHKDKVIKISRAPWLRNINTIQGREAYRNAAEEVKQLQTYFGEKRCLNSRVRIGIGGFWGIIQNRLPDNSVVPSSTTFNNPTDLQGIFDRAKIMAATTGKHLDYWGFNSLFKAPWLLFKAVTDKKFWTLPNLRASPNEKGEMTIRVVDTGLINPTGFLDRQVCRFQERLCNIVARRAGVVFFR